MIAQLASLFLSGATVTLPMEAVVSGQAVELGELARIESADSELQQALARLDLGYAPAPGHSRVLQAERIAAEIRRTLPEAEVRFAGQAACRVRPAVERVTAARIREAARDELARVLGARDVVLEPTGELVDVDVPSDEQAYELRARFTSGEVASGAASVPVQILVGGNPYRTVWTSWRVQVYETVPVLARAVRAGDALRPADFERRRLALNPGGAQLALVPEAVLGAVAVRDLASGSVVTGHDLHRPVMVESGRSVLLEVRKGAIEARMPAMARGSGAVGDSVRVITLDGGRELVAVVVGRDLVRLDLGQ